jgi:hypothetical protein
LAWRSGNPDLSGLLINAVRWIMKEPAAPASLQGNGSLETFAWETEPGFALHILNYSNPNALRPFVSQLYPVGPLQAEFRFRAIERSPPCAPCAEERISPFAM